MCGGGAVEVKARYKRVQNNTTYFGNSQTRSELHGLAIPRCPVLDTSTCVA